MADYELHDHLLAACTILGLPSPEAYWDATNWSGGWAPLVALHRIDKHIAWVDEAPIEDGILPGVEAGFVERFMLESALRYLHAAGDLLAQLVNIVLCTPPIPESDCSLGALVARLTDADAVKVVARIDALRDAPEYQHVAAMVNAMKHRKMLDDAYVVDIPPLLSLVPPTGAIRFFEFEYKATFYPSTDRTDIARFVERIRALVFDVVVELVEVAEERAERVKS